ncbi:MAG: hypothetical protein WAN86_19085 [Hyphomicrobiaceae bacterium]
MEPRGYSGGPTASPHRRRKLILYVLILALTAGLASTARAQLPPLFGPEPDFSKPPQCSRERVRLLAGQLEALEKLRASGPEAIGRICALIGMGSAWLGREPDARGKLRELLGFDIDLERAETQCRAGQDGIARELTTMIARLRAELLRCDTV